MARKRALTDLACDRAEAVDRPKKLFLGDHGVYLLVTSQGSKLWRMKYRFGGVEKLLALGSYPEVRIADQLVEPNPTNPGREERLLIPGVRTRALQARQMMTMGIDPGQARKEAKANKRAIREQEAAEASNTLRSVSEAWLEHMIARSKQTLKNAGVIRGRLNNHVFPTLGSMAIRSITVNSIEHIYKPLVDAGKTTTANRTVGYLENIFNWAMGQEPSLVETNPATRWRKRGDSAPEKTQHHPALVRKEEFARLVRAIYGSDAGLLVGTALKLLLLTFVRPGNLLNAEWAEFDLEKASWVIPKRKLKCKGDGYDDLLVPLSPHAVELIRSVKSLTSHNKYVFANQKTGKPISGNALRKALEKEGVSAKEHHLHGFRATATTRLKEDLDARHEYVELQLHHRIKDPNREAYNRATHLRRRRNMMIKWSKLIENTAKGACDDQWQ